MDVWGSRRSGRRVCLVTKRRKLGLVSFSDHLKGTLEMVHNEVLRLISPPGFHSAPPSTDTRHRSSGALMCCTRIAVCCGLLMKNSGRQAYAEVWRRYVDVGDSCVVDLPRKRIDVQSEANKLR